MINKFLLVLFLVVGSVMVSHAQPAPLSDPGTPTSLSSTNNAPPPPPAPIPDGGFILLGLAFIYGISKYLQVRKQVKTI